MCQAITKINICVSAKKDNNELRQRLCKFITVSSCYAAMMASLVIMDLLVHRIGHGKLTSPIALCFLFIYLVGVPVTYAYVLFRLVPKRGKDDKVVEHNYGFIYSRFEDDWYFWEVHLSPQHARTASPRDRACSCIPTALLCARS